MIILITGATDGLGLEIAKLYHARGHRLVLLGRRPLAQLDSELFSETNYVQADLTASGCCERVEAWLRDARIQRLDMLIHNAGLGFVGELESQSRESIEQLVQVNLIAPILLTRTLLPWLLSTNGAKDCPARPKLVFIGSVVTALATPKFAVYGATKAALQGFARSLRVELAGRVGVLMIHPGATRTGMHQKAGMNEEQTRRFAPAASVACEIVFAIEKGKKNSTLGFVNKALRALGPLFNRPQLVRCTSGGDQPHVMITGGADGIGRALVESYAQAHYRITFLDIDEAKGAQLEDELSRQGVDIRFLRVDLLSGEESYLGELTPLDVLVHNAGINSTGYFETLAPVDQRRVLRLNLLVPLQMTARILERGLLTDTGSLVLISSLSHFVSYPGAAAYAASKDGLAHFGRSLWSGLGPKQGALTVFPGPTRTAHAHRHSPDNSKEATRMAPEVLAERIFAAQQARRRILLPDAGAKGSALLGRLFPGLAEFAMRKVLLEKFPKPRE